MKLLITRPEHDITTKYLSCWSQEILDVAKNKGVTIFDLNREKASKKELSGRINKLNPLLIILNGHGDEDRVSGHDNKILIKANYNDNLLAEKITYAISCKSAKKLGRKVAANKKSTYIGYVDDFVFAINSNQISKPLKDKRAEPFMRSSNYVAISLLKGHDSINASKRSKQMFRKNYLKLLTKQSNSNAIQDAQLLWWNMKHQTCLGNKNKRFSF